MNFIGMDLLLRRVLRDGYSNDLEAFRESALALDVERGGAINGMGVKFDQIGHNVRGNVVAMQWQDGDLVTIYPKELALGTIRHTNRIRGTC